MNNVTITYLLSVGSLMVLMMIFGKPFREDKPDDAKPYSHKQTRYKIHYKIKNNRG